MGKSLVALRKNTLTCLSLLSPSSFKDGGGLLPLTLRIRAPMDRITVGFTLSPPSAFSMINAILLL